MNKLKDLMQELCPNGVEYKKLADCCVLEKGYTPIQKAIPGEYPLVVTTEERKSCSTYQFDKPTVCIPLVSSRGHGVASLNRLYYQDGKFALGNILCGVTPVNSDELSAKFLFYYLNHKKDPLIVPLMRGGANVSLTVDSLKRVKVPIPPIPVQYEIVRIFDKFESLRIELTAELTARKKQYEYYATQLLCFDNTVEWVTLGEVADITDYVANGSFASLRENVTYKNEPDFAVLIRTADYSSGFNLDKMVYIDEHAYNFLAKSKLVGGEIIINNIGAGVGTTFRCPKLNTPMSLAPNAVMIKTENDAFYYYWFKSKWGQDALQKIVGKSAMPKFNKTGLRSIKVPVPHKEIQQRIIDILERFEVLCTDISEGLPAEIEARQKQYEYYRDKLLTFKEVNQC